MPLQAVTQGMNSDLQLRDGINSVLQSLWKLKANLGEETGQLALLPLTEFRDAFGERRMFRRMSLVAVSEGSCFRWVVRMVAYVARQCRQLTISGYEDDQGTLAVIEYGDMQDALLPTTQGLY